MSHPAYPTPHIAATPADFAATVLMPGDPQRAQFIAENYLTAPRLVNNVRGVQGDTGSYQGVPVSVMASGMGMPSMGIYAYELFQFFEVENILRIGSAGALSEKLRVRDIVLGMGACTNSNFAAQYHLPGTFAPICSYDLLHACTAAAEREKIPVHVGNLLSSDTFYNDDADLPAGLTSNRAFAKMGVLAVEMEAAALYMNAARCGKNALAICTVSDHIVTGETTTAEERRATFRDMMRLALETAAAL